LVHLHTQETGVTDVILHSGDTMPQPTGRVSCFKAVVRI